MDLLTNSFTHVWYILKAILNDIEHSLKYKFKFRKGLFRSELLIWLFYQKLRATQLLASALYEMTKLNQNLKKIIQGQENTLHCKKYNNEPRSMMSLRDRMMLTTHS